MSGMGSYTYSLSVYRQGVRNREVSFFPSGNLEELTKLADVALQLPYVRMAEIVKMSGMRSWSEMKDREPRVYLKRNAGARPSFVTEQEFLGDLQKALQDDGLFARICANKQRYERYVQRGGRL